MRGWKGRCRRVACIAAAFESCGVQSFPSEHEEELLPSEGDGALEQAAQGGVESPSPEIFKTRLDKVLCSLL